MGGRLAGDESGCNVLGDEDSRIDQIEATLASWQAGAQRAAPLQSAREMGVTHEEKTPAGRRRYRERARRAVPLR